MKSENEKHEGGLANLANLANSTLERAKQALTEPDGGLPREQAEAGRNLKLYRYRLRDCPGSDLILIAPGESLDEARKGLRRKYGGRLLDVREYRRP